MKSKADIPRWFWDRSDSSFLARQLNIVKNKYYVELLSFNYVICYINELKTLNQLLGLDEEINVINEIYNILSWPGLETGEIRFIRNNVTGIYLDWKVELVEYPYDE